MCWIKVSCRTWMPSWSATYLIVSNTTIYHNRNHFAAIGGVKFKGETESSINVGRKRRLYECNCFVHGVLIALCRARLGNGNLNLTYAQLLLVSRSRRWTQKRLTVTQVRLVAGGTEHGNAQITPNANNGPMVSNANLYGLVWLGWNLESGDVLLVAQEMEWRFISWYFRN